MSFLCMLIYVHAYQTFSQRGASYVLMGTATATVSEESYLSVELEVNLRLDERGCEAETEEEADQRPPAGYCRYRSVTQKHSVTGTEILNKTM